MREENPMVSLSRGPNIDNSIDKLLYTAGKYGVGGLRKQQGASMAVMDTALIANNAGRQVLSFFKNTQQKSPNFTNLQQGVFTSGNSLVCQYVSLLFGTLNSADLTDDANFFTSIFPIYELGGTAGPSFSAGTMNLKISNDTVVPDYPLLELNPFINPDNCGITNAAATDIVAGQSRIPLASMPVILPDEKFELTLDLPPIAGMAANSAVIAMIGRWGTTFSNYGAR